MLCKRCKCQMIEVKDQAVQYLDRRGLIRLSRQYKCVSCGHTHSATEPVVDTRVTKEERNR